ncbi:MAG: AraC family transcriptional regulator [Alphaproteobacteria bacterium]|nr:AraC family transcriptional regulator [Alphaproteobacteria bacterium]
MEALERLSFDRSFARAPRHPSGLDSAVRFCPPSHVGEGYEDGFATEDNCLLTTKQLKVLHDFQETEPGVGRLVFLFHLSGNRVVEIPGLARHALNVPCFVAYYHPDGVSKVSLWSRGGWDTGVTIGFDGDDPPPAVSGLLPEAVRNIQLSIDDDPKFTWFQNPLTPEMARVAGALISPNIHSSLLRGYISAKSRELLYLGLDSILNVHSIRSEGTDAIRRKIETAKQILDENTRDKITVEMLAEELGMAPATLSKHFTQAFKRSVQEYAAESRMTKAVHLLVSTKMPMKQIAYEVGYNHVSNFCLAFKRRFGTTARRVRLEGRGVEMD